MSRNISPNQSNSLYISEVCASVRASDSNGANMPLICLSAACVKHALAASTFLSAMRSGASSSSMSTMPPSDGFWLQQWNVYQEAHTLEGRRAQWPNDSSQWFQTLSAHSAAHNQEAFSGRLSWSVAIVWLRKVTGYFWLNSPSQVCPVLDVPRKHFCTFPAFLKTCAQMLYNPAGQLATERNW